jgi:hypothetical protein
MVVVGILTRTPNINVALTLTGPSPTQFNFTDLVSNTGHIYDVPFNISRPTNMETYIYRWFNWGALDFTLFITQFNGQASFYLNVISEDNYLESVASGVPIAAANSFWTAQPAVSTMA